MRLALSTILEKVGYAVLPANDGDEALALLETSDVVLILCNPDAQATGGRELLRALLAHPVHAGLPVVAVLACPWDALTIQADAFLVKPFLTEADVRAALQRALGSTPIRPPP